MSKYLPNERQPANKDLNKLFFKDKQNKIRFLLSLFNIINGRVTLSD